MSIFSKFAATFAVSMIIAAPAIAVTLDFDSGTPVFSGANNLTGYSQDGLVFDISFSGGGNSVSANLFDTTCSNAAVTNCSSAGDDLDLVPAPQGLLGIANNVLIIQEANTSLQDDSGSGGTITFTLTSGPVFEVLGFSAIDDGTFELSVGGGSAGTIINLNDNEVGSILGSPSPLTNSFTIDYLGSGAVDSIVLNIPNVIPLPASLPMILVGLGGLGWVARRKRV
ncbi:MAG: VPLPA-CTERM sorting domain-containing protein [Pseudomonadota bacterium]